MNPAQIHAFGKAELSRTKTDQSDAKLSARFCRAQHPPPGQPPPPAIGQLQALVRRLDKLLEMRQMERNRQDSTDPTIPGSITTLLATLNAQIAQIRARIRNPIGTDPPLRQRRDLLDSIPGVGEATIAVLLACLGEVQRFDEAKAVAAFAGLSPAERQSGKYRGQSRLSKTGDPLLRKALYLPAVVACPHKPVLRAFSEPLQAQAKPGKVIICAAMRKLLTLAYGVLKSARPFDPDLALAH